MAVPEATVQGWMRKLERYLRRYQSHPEYEEILASGYLGLAQGIARAEERGYAEQDGYVLRCGWNQARTFLRSAGSWERTHSYYGTPRPEVVSLDAILAGGGVGHLGIEPDFVPPLLNRLEIRRQLARLPAPVRTALCLWAAGEDPEQIARRLGVSAGQVRRWTEDQEKQAVQWHCQYRGVGYDRQKHRPWVARYRLACGRRLRLGSWLTAEEAALAYDAAVLCYGHGLGRLNLLPDEVRDERQEEEPEPLRDRLEVAAGGGSTPG